MNEPRLNKPRRLMIRWKQLQKGEIVESCLRSAVYRVPVVGRVWIPTCLIEEANGRNGQVQLVLTASKLLDGQDHHPHWFCVGLEDAEEMSETE